MSILVDFNQVFISNIMQQPNLNVYRPADAVETLECWELALQTNQTPSIIALSRQNLPQIRLEHKPENLSSKGGVFPSGTRMRSGFSPSVAAARGARHGGGAW